MGDKTSIEWTDATWNPVRGCSIVSKGCTNCYAMKMAHRSSGAGGAYEGLTKLTKGGPVWTGEIKLMPELLERPLRWRRPRRIFVNSMSDLFHESVPDKFIYQVFGVMAIATRHTFQVLTKRPARMMKLLNAGGFVTAKGGFPPKNIWLGVSVEDQASADERIPLLLQTPAAVRWISAEPLLGPIDLERLRVPGTTAGLNALFSGTRLGWVVVGGESGPGARPMHPDWARALRDQCQAAGVPFFFKQWGNWVPHARALTEAPAHTGVFKFENATERNPFGVYSIHMPKKAAGRELDGRTHDEYPA